MQKSLLFNIFYFPSPRNLLYASSLAFSSSFFFSICCMIHDFSVVVESALDSEAEGFVC